MPRRSVRAEQLVGPLEYAILDSLWRRGSGTVAEVLEDVNGVQDPPLAYTTVMTVLSRLHEKGLVLREQQGRGYRYAPTHTEQELVERLAKRDVDRMVDTYGELALAHFAERLDQADPELLDRLRRLAVQESEGLDG